MRIFAEHVYLPKAQAWHKDVVLTLFGPHIQTVEHIPSCDVNENKQMADMVCHYVYPNYVDLQVNGGGGILFTEHTNSTDIKQVSRVHASSGTGAMLPTLITHHQAAMENMADMIASVIAEQAESQRLSSGILGVHFEGPWLSKVKKGIHLEAHIRAPSDVELACVTRQDLGQVLLTLAPETVPVDVIADLVKQGVTVALGHSNATVEQTLAALAAGASGFTHLYNAMSGLQGRNPGVLGAALGESDTFAGIIADGHHVSPYAIKLAYQNKGSDKLVLVTDAMAHAGYAADVLPYFATEITRQGNRLTTPDGALAGSCLTMHEAVLYMHEIVGIELFECVKMAASTPLDWLGVPHFNGIKEGHRANFIALDSELAIQANWCEGREVV